jgi:serine/threonine-protein kinase
MAVAIAPDTVLLGKYRIERVLGRGGMGVVVRARHIDLDEVVAIKLLRGDEVITHEMFARFAREAKAAAKLKSRHVVRVTDVGRLDDGMPYMVMELLEGLDLSQTVRTKGPLEVGVAAQMIIQACEALAEAHALGIVHRDVKPSNLFVVARPDRALPLLKVLDFGIAKAPESMDFSLTKTASVLGTPAYMSPEQLRSSRGVDARSDIWALGVVLYEIIEGRRPFEAEQFSELILKIGVDAPNPVTRMAPPMHDIVMKCLAKDPQERYQRVSDLAVALAPFTADHAAAQHGIEEMLRLQASAALMSLDPQTPQ